MISLCIQSMVHGIGNGFGSWLASQSQKVVIFNKSKP